MAYVAWRAYARRLDAVIGPANWSFKLLPKLLPWGPTRLVAELTILGITKSATGEGDPTDSNCGTSAEAQAKKRAYAEFGLGRYLCDLLNLVRTMEGDLQLSFESAALTLQDGQTWKTLPGTSVQELPPIPSLSGAQPLLTLVVMQWQ